MHQSFKKLIFTFVAIGLLFSFQASAFSDSFLEKSEAFDISEDETDSENKHSELKPSKFFGENSQEFKILKITLHLENKDHIALRKTFDKVPTSPPNC